MFVKARGAAGDQGPRSVRRRLEGEPRRGEGRRQDLPATGTRSRSPRYRYTVKIFPLQVHNLLNAVGTISGRREQTMKHHLVGML